MAFEFLFGGPGRMLWRFRPGYRGVSHGIREAASVSEAIGARVIDGNEKHIFLILRNDRHLKQLVLFCHVENSLPFVVDRR